MAIDKLKYNSQNVSIAREIQKYPIHLGIREAIQNAIEGDGNTGASDIQIIPLNMSASEQTGKASKFAIWDNGPGMTADALKKLTDKELNNLMYINARSIGKTIAVERIMEEIIRRSNIKK